MGRKTGRLAGLPDSEREQFAQFHRQLHIAFRAQLAEHEGLHAADLAAGNAFEGLAVHDQSDVGLLGIAWWTSQVPSLTTR